MKRLLVCGSRTYSDRAFLFEALDACWKRAVFIDELVHGAAAGADRLASEWAMTHSIPQRPFVAQWTKVVDGKQVFNKAAGTIRNKKMLDTLPELVIAFTDKPLASSVGTNHMVKIARKAEITVIVYEPHDTLVGRGPELVDPQQSLFD